MVQSVQNWVHLIAPTSGCAKYEISLLEGQKVGALGSTAPEHYMSQQMKLCMEFLNNVVLK